jgi:hypothetical protein
VGVAGRKGPQRRVPEDGSFPPAGGREEASSPDAQSHDQMNCPSATVHADVQVIGENNLAVKLSLKVVLSFAECWS